MNKILKAMFNLVLPILFFLGFCGKAISDGNEKHNKLLENIEVKQLELNVSETEEYEKLKKEILETLSLAVRTHFLAQNPQKSKPVNVYSNTGVSKDDKTKKEFSSFYPREFFIVSSNSESIGNQDIKFLMDIPIICFNGIEYFYIKTFNEVNYIKNLVPVFSKEDRLPKTCGN